MQTFDVLLEIRLRAALQHTTALSVQECDSKHMA